MAKIKKIEEKITLKSVAIEVWQVIRRHFWRLVLVGTIYLLISMLGGTLLRFYAQSNLEINYWLIYLLIFLILILVRLGLIRYISDLQIETLKTETKEASPKKKKMAVEAVSVPKISVLWQNWSRLPSFLLASIGTTILTLIVGIPFWLIVVGMVFLAIGPSWEAMITQLASGNFTNFWQWFLPSNLAKGQIIYLVIAAIVLLIGMGIEVYVWSRYYLTEIVAALGDKSQQYLKTFRESSRIVYRHQWQLIYVIAIIMIMELLGMALFYDLRLIFTQPLSILITVVFYRQLLRKTD